MPKQPVSKQSPRSWRVSSKRPEDSCSSKSFYSTQAAIYSTSRAIKRIQERLTLHALSLCLFPEGARVLDAGCGNGFSTRVLLDLGYDAIGVDSSPEMIALAKKNNVNAVVGDLRALPFPANEFDGLISISALQWVANDAGKAASEFYRVLKKGGKVYADTPFIQVYHGSPRDYRRFTYEGHETLFSGFHKVRNGVSIGPSSTFTLISKYYFATLLSFNSTLLFSFWLNLFGWIFFPIKYLDFFLEGHHKAYLMASSTYYIGEKK